MSMIDRETKGSAPFPAREGHFLKGPEGIPLYVEVRGDRAAQIKILLVHGILQSSLCYRQQIEELAAQGCFVLALDLPWHGLSGPGPAQGGLVPTPKLLGECLDAVCIHYDLLEEPLTLLGWSYGAQVIRNFVLLCQPRNIAGLVLVAPQLDVASLLPIGLREIPEVVEVVQALAASATPMAERHALLQEFVQLLWHRPPALSKYYHILGYNFRAFASAAPVLDTLAFGTEMPGDIHRALRDVHCPILLVQGQQDRLVPPDYTRQLAQRLSSEQVQLLEVSDCGHSPFLEYPEVFNRELLAFLAGPVRQKLAGSV